MHRDLKPGNVMLTRSGAKLMDFGLARAPAVAVARNGISTARSRDYDVGPDGRIVTVRALDGQDQLKELRVLLNWTHDLQRLKAPGH